jgi:opacity protein-like surface antigen
MRFGWRAIVFLLLATFVSPASAEDRAGFYAGLRLVGSVADLQDVEGVNFTGPLVENQNSDIVGGGGGVVGYRWGRLPVRTELEVAYRVRFDWNNRDNGSPAVGYQNNLDSTNVLFNILLEYRNKSDFTPFAGGTFGWVRNHSSVERTNLTTSSTVSQDFTENNLAWGVMLGLDWAFARRWSAEFAYRYINLGPASTGTFSGGDEVKANAYVAHDIMLSGMYKW